MLVASSEAFRVSTRTLAQGVLGFRVYGLKGFSLALIVTTPIKLQTTPAVLCLRKMGFRVEGVKNQAVLQKMLLITPVSSQWVSTESIQC